MAGRHGLEIRAPTAADAPQLTELLAAIGRPIAAPALADNLDTLRREGGTALMAQEWGPTTGLIVLHWRQPLVGPRSALMSLLLVADEARRRGVGRLLLKAGAHAARTAGCGELQAWIQPDTGALAAFCRATGFTEDGATFTRSLRRHG